MRVRRALNVESGLNDGIVTPIVVFALAIAGTRFGASDESGGVLSAALELAIGVAVGLSLGYVSAKLIVLASRRRWVLHGGRRLAVLATAVGGYALATVFGGNGFIAAFVAGIAFGAAFPRNLAEVEEVAELPELLGEVLALAVWFLFGATLLPVAFHYFSPTTIVYVVLSLTVVRMLPVALGLTGAGMDAPTVMFIGWFGPRGLASVVFALLAIEELVDSDAVGQAVSVVALTVLLSVVAHGVSARPLARRYAGHHGGAPSAMEAAPRSRRRGA